MNILEKDSFYSIKNDFSLSRTDESVLSSLYLPFLKADSFSLYLALYQNSSLSEPYFLHSDLLSTLEFKASDFLKARERLEAIGLLRTYRKETRDNYAGVKVFYRYVLIPPATPKKFFNDIVLRNLLQQSVSQKAYVRLQSYFMIQEDKNDDSFVDVSVKFSDVYTLNGISDENAEIEIEDKKYESVVSFDIEKLRNELSFLGLSFADFKQNEKEILEYSVLYGIDEATCAKCIKENTDSDNVLYLDKFLSSLRRIVKFNRELNNGQQTASLGSGKSSKKIKAYDSYPPKKFLQEYFKTEPNVFMLKLVEKLKHDFSFSNGMINVVLDFSLAHTNKEFNETYIEKVAYSLSANGAKDTYDAYTMLKSRDFEIKNSVGRKKKSSVSSKVVKNEGTDDKSEITKEEADDILGDIGL